MCRSTFQSSDLIQTGAGAVAVAETRPFAGLANFGSGGGARSLKPGWVRDIIADCRRRALAPFHKQWGTYSSNPLVVEQGMSIAEARAIDKLEREGA